MGYTSDGWLEFENGTNLSNGIRIFLNFSISLYGILLLVAGSLGNFGLAFVLIYDRRRSKVTTRVLFCLLALADTMVLWIAVLRYCIRMMVGWDFRVAYPALCRFHVFAVYVSTNLAVTVFCTLCIDRCFVIYHSLEGYWSQFVKSNPHGNTSEAASKTFVNNVLVTQLPHLQNRTQQSKCVLLGMRLFHCICIRRTVNQLCCCTVSHCGVCAKTTDEPTTSIPNHIELELNHIITTPNRRAHSFACSHTHQDSFDVPPSASMKQYSPRYSSALEKAAPVAMSKHDSSRSKSFCDRLTSFYTRNSTRCLTIGLTLGSVLVVIKHLVAYQNVRVEPVRGCYGGSLARWRDYLDFVAQAIIPYLIIIPANALVYRAMKRHQAVLTALRMSINRGNTSFDQKRSCGDLSRVLDLAPPCLNMSSSPVNLASNDLRESATLQNTSRSSIINILRSPLARHHQYSTKVMVATATHLSRNHLFIFKTLITLSILQFVINLPGHLYAQVILPSLNDWWFSTVEGHLLYDSLFLISYTNNGVSFFILLCTVRGFRMRVCSAFKRSCFGRVLNNIKRRRFMQSPISSPHITSNKELLLRSKLSKKTLSQELKTSHPRNPDENVIPGC